MSAEITLEQIKALKADYFRDLDLSDPSSLIFNFYGVEGKQAYELYQTACLTQERLLAGIGALGMLLQDRINNLDNGNVETIREVLVMLSDLTGLIRGINATISYLVYEAKLFEH